MLGSHSLLIVGIILLAVGFTLESGANGAVKAIKMRAKLATGDDLATSNSRVTHWPEGPPDVGRDRARPANPAERKLG
jgi:hypothetical protein